MKKVLGFIFILLGSVFALAFIAQIPKVLGVIPRILSGDSYQMGYALGMCISWVLLTGLAYFLFKYGVKWMKRSPKHPASLD